MAKDEFGLNTNNIATKDDSYVETLVIDGKMVNVYINDPGQCYWFQWVDEKGELHSQSCGTYNLDYLEEIKSYFRTSEDILREIVTQLRYTVFNLMRDVDTLKKAHRELKFNTDKEPDECGWEGK